MSVIFDMTDDVAQAIARLGFDARSTQVKLLRLQLDWKLCSPNILGIGTSADITC